MYLLTSLLKIIIHHERNLLNHHLNTVLLEQSNQLLHTHAHTRSHKINYKAARSQNCLVQLLHITKEENEG